MKKMILFLAVLQIAAVFGSCRPDGYNAATTAGLIDLWVLESGDITETLDLYYEKGKFRLEMVSRGTEENGVMFDCLCQIQGTDIVEPVTGTYNVRRSYDYGQKWEILTLTPDGEDPIIYSYKMTLSFDKRVLALEGSGVSYYYRVEKEKDSQKEADE